MNISNGEKLGNEIARVYGGIYSSELVIDAVKDYCVDAELKFDYEQLMTACGIISKENSVTRPTADMVIKLADDLKVFQRGV